MIFSLELLRMPSRLYDPVGIVLCVDCGRLTAHQVLMAELISVQALPEAWNDFSTVISGAKEALAVRSEMAFGPGGHDGMSGF